MSQVLAQLAEFETLSRTMLQAAENQSWELLEQLSGEREAVQAQLSGIAGGASSTRRKSTRPPACSRPA